MVACMYLLSFYYGHLNGHVYSSFSALIIMINDLSNTASSGGHASDWSLAIHSNVLAGHLHGHLQCV